MSSSSDIEKLFDEFGGDANAYQEIGRENDASSARTRWPLLVTLDLTQPAIPAVGQRREPRPQPATGANSAAAAAGNEQALPSDVASVTRAKAPLFTRSHRRDIPPVLAAAAPAPGAAPSGGLRFGRREDIDETLRRQTQAQAAAQQAAANPSAAQAASAGPLNSLQPVASAAASAPAWLRSQAAATTERATLAPDSTAASTQAFVHAFVPASEQASMQTSAQTSAQPSTMATPTTPTSPQAQPHAYGPAASLAQGYAQTATQTPTQPAAPPSILGKLFDAQPQSATTEPAADPARASLQSVFERLRGTPAPAPASAPTAAPTPASALSAAPSSPAAPGAPASWLVNGPRRS